MKKLRLILLGITFALFNTSAFAFDTKVNTEMFEMGEELHEESCADCHSAPHDKEFYTREGRMVNDSFTLRSQVSRCVGFFQTGWFPEEEQSVVYYLNQEFYKFAK